MKSYLGKRIVTAVLCVFLALLFNFIIIHAAPGNPIRILAGTDSVNEEMIAELTQKYGLDQPAYIQFFRYNFRYRQERKNRQ